MDKYYYSKKSFVNRFLLIYNLFPDGDGRRRGGRGPGGRSRRVRDPERSGRRVVAGAARPGRAVRQRPVSPDDVRLQPGIRREVFDAVGGWDETYPTAGSDVEFCWRVQTSGYRFGYARDAMVAYRFRTGMRESWHQVVDYGREDARVAKQYGAPGRQWWWLPVHAGVVVALCPVWPWAWSQATARRMGLAHRQSRGPAVGQHQVPRRVPVTRNYPGLWEQKIAVPGK